MDVRENGGVGLAWLRGMEGHSNDGKRQWTVQRWTQYGEEGN